MLEKNAAEWAKMSQALNAAAMCLTDAIDAAHEIGDKQIAEELIETKAGLYYLRDSAREQRRRSEGIV